MTAKPTITFTKLSAPKKGSVILLLADDLALSPTGLLCDPAGQLARSFPISGFKGSFGAASELLAPEGAGADHLKALARVSRLLRNAQVCEKLRGAEDRAALYAILTEPLASSQAA